MASKPQPAGFGKCANCAYRATGTPDICYSCARRTVPAIRGRRCRVCELALPKAGECGNPICGWPDRFFERNYAVAYRTKPLERAINRYKYEGKTGWALIFARVLLGYLAEHRDRFQEFDLIIPSPSFVDPERGRPFHHTLRVLAEASRYAEPPWPFDLTIPPAIVKTAATTRLAGRSWKERQQIAQGPFRAALDVPDPSRTRGQHILVYDDIFTDGHTLNEVARALKVRGGASRVAGLTLARQSWNARPANDRRRQK